MAVVFVADDDKAFFPSAKVELSKILATMQPPSAPTHLLPPQSSANRYVAFFFWLFVAF